MKTIIMSKQMIPLVPIKVFSAYLLSAFTFELLLCPPLSRFVSNERSEWAVRKGVIQYSQGRPSDHTNCGRRKNGSDLFSQKRR